MSGQGHQRDAGAGRATAPPLLRRVGITPAISSEVADPSRQLPLDPADLIIFSSARVIGATHLTRAQPIIDSGIVAVL